MKAILNLNDLTASFFLQGITGAALSNLQAGFERPGNSFKLL